MNLKKYPSIGRFLLRSLIILAMPALFSFSTIHFRKNHFVPVPSPGSKSLVLELYNMLSLDSLGLSRMAFEEAVTGYMNLQRSGILQKRSVLSIVDFSIPSSKKRLFVLDMENGKLLFNTLVAHGRNSGELLATRFSNKFRSYKSSLGFYLTGATYQGQNGYALRLLGIEKGINDNAYNRGIVIHAAPYVNDDISKTYGRLGRSEGCPAIPIDIHRPVIETIKEGTCLFIYGNDKRYASRSRILKEQKIS